MSLLFEIRWILYKVSPHQPSKVDETNPVAWSLWSFVVSICFSAKHLETSHMKHNWATLFWGFGVDIKHLWLDPRMKLAKAKDVATYHWNNKFYWSSFAGFLSKTTTQTERMLIDKTKMNTHVMIYIYLDINIFTSSKHMFWLVHVTAEVLTFWKHPQWSSC